MIKDQTLYASRLLTVITMIAVLVAAFAFYEIRFGGPIERKHALHNELLADVLPPPAYVVEPFLETTQIVLDPRDAGRRLSRLAALESEYRQRRGYWSRIELPEESRAQLDRVIGDADRFWRVVDGPFAHAVRAGDFATARRLHRTEVSTLYARQHEEVIGLVALSRSYTDAQMVRDNWIVGGCLVLAGLLALTLVLGVRRACSEVDRRIVEPLSAASRTLGHLANGEYRLEIANLTGTDEFGTMARAMDVFRRNGIAKQQADAAQTQVVEALSLGLQRLAAKDLEYRIAEPFPGDYEALRVTFNDAVGSLCRVLAAVRVGAGGVMTAISEIRAGSDDLALRNQQQAASLEETAAAMRQANARVRDAASSAAEAQTGIGHARDQAEKGRAVVRTAIEAMAQIESSSDAISSIVNVIDGIAFQTNLLALNAGVEAARAGDAGKGFAVVANEVRALAQRSADAAQDIKGLITKSGEHVGQGVALVGQTGDRLAAIAAQVADLHALIDAMTRSSQAQAADLDQATAAVEAMDRTTQHNAAMVEETTAATRSLEGEATTLTAMMSSFRTRDPESRPGHAPAAGRLRRTTAAGEYIAPPPPPVAMAPIDAAA